MAHDDRLKTIDLVSVQLAWAEDDPGPPASHLLRGTLAERFRDNPLFHQHQDERLLYRYPRIQYRWNRQGAGLLGLGEGIRALAQLDWPGLELRIGNRLLHVRDAVCRFTRHTVTPADRLIRYRFVAPWLPFNQNNFERYQTMKPDQQAQERDRLVVAGLLIALRGYGINFDARLFAAVQIQQQRRCRYKDAELLGFTGQLLANVDLPDGFALGRAVSHGFGWIERLSCQQSQHN